MSVRSRWAAFGAAVAVLLGGGTLLTASAAGSPLASSMVPITPCRLLDTRAGSDNIGPRAAPLGPNESFPVAVWGTNGNCTIPSGATGVSLGLVVVNPTAPSFLTVFPADATRPLSSSLNWVAGQAPTPNAVTAALSADGRLALYNLAGTVDVVVDIVGYYEPSAAGSVGPQGPQGPQGPPGPPGPNGIDGADASAGFHVVTVAKSGGDYTSVSAALGAITGTLNEPYLVRVGPGMFDEPSGIALEPYVAIEGSGRGITTLSAPGTAPNSATVNGTGNLTSAELRQLSIVNTGVGSIVSRGIFLVDTSGELRLKDVAVRGGNVAAQSLGTAAFNASITVTNAVTAGGMASFSAGAWVEGLVRTDGMTATGGTHGFVLNGGSATIMNSALAGFPNAARVSGDSTAIFLASTISSGAHISVFVGSTAACTGLVVLPSTAVNGCP